MKSKPSSTNPKGPIKQWVPKSKIVNATNMPKGKRKAQVMVPGQWMLNTHDMRVIYVPHPRNEGRRKFEVWRQPIWQDHWYKNYYPEVVPTPEAQEEVASDVAQDGSQQADQSKNTFKYKSSLPEDQIIGNKEIPRRTRSYFRPE